MPGRQTSINFLVDKADVHGYLTTDDLIENFPTVDAQRLSILVKDLHERGVDVVDDDYALDLNPEPDSVSIEFDHHSGDAFASDDPVGLYLKDMPRVPLLTVVEELDLAIRIEKGRRAQRKSEGLRGQGSGRIRRKLAPVIQDGIAARDHLIKANTRLVVSIAKRYMVRGVPFLDLIQEGNLGLMKAVEK